MLDNHLHRLGYWLVNDQPFFNKVLAAIEATVQNTHDVKFYFNDHVYGAIDWRIPLPQSLEFLYQQRARQLREKYQYLVMLYSGGSDSHNALKAMMTAGVLPDEIVYHWVGGPNSQYNLNNAEIIHAAWPMLKYLEKQFDVKVTCFDEFDLYSKYGFSGPEWVLEADATLCPGNYPRYQMLQDHSPWKRLRDQGQKVGLVMGLDKPRILWENGRWHGVFLDVGIAHNYTRDHFQDNGITIEAFYVSPEAALITIKQSQVLKEYCTRTWLPDFFHQNFSRHNWNAVLYNTLVRQICYPFWDDRTFSIGKGPPVYNQKYTWWLQGSTELKNNYFLGIDWIDQHVDDVWLNKNTAHHGMRGTFSRTYALE